MSKAAKSVSPRTERTRERILLYSANRFRERGIRKVTVDELCVDMAVSKRTFYKYFRGRDDLVETIVEKIISEASGAIKENLLSDRPASEALRIHVGQVSSLFDNHSSTLMMADIQSTMPELWEKVVGLRREIVEQTIKTIRRGQAEGDIRGDIGADVLGKVIQGISDTVGNPVFALSNGLSLDQLGGTLLEIVLHGILARDESA
jgi:AcrR family transcriptional regulator